jgi:hypothetical protein
MKNNQARKLQVVFTLLKLPILLFLQAARDILAMMTGNPNYTTPFPALADVGAGLDDLEAKITAAAGRDKIAMAERKTAWVKAKLLMGQLGNYVQGHCQNDLDILLSSGFNPTKVPAPIGALAAPISPICRQGEFSGVLRARTRRVYGATVYFWRVALASAPTVYVKTAETNGCRCEFTGLTPGEIYLTEVSVMGTAGQSNYSSAGSLMVI